MDFKVFFEKYGAYLVAAVLFVAAACIYCSPSLGGKKLFAGDEQNYIGASQETRDFRKESSEETFWNGAMFSGMPNYQIGGAHYGSDALIAPLSWLVSHNGNPVKMLILYLVCFFIMMRCFGVDKWLSIAGAFAVTLSSYFLVIIPAGHFTKITSIALCGVMLGGFNLCFNKKYLLGAILTMVATALGFKPHPQMFYYFCMLAGVMWIAVAWQQLKDKHFKELGLGTLVFILSAAIGIGTASSNVFANAEYAAETMRGRHSDLIREGDDPSAAKGLDIEYATQWSYGIDETMSLLIPGFKGGANSIDVGKDSDLYKIIVENGVSAGIASQFAEDAPLYWGDQPFTSGNVYVGAIVVFLFLLGLVIVRGPVKWALLVATLFSIALAWGHNWMGLTSFFFEYFPMYSKFRAVSSILVVAEVAMPLLGFLALKEIVERKGEINNLAAKIWITGGISAGICLFFGVFGSMIYDFQCASDGMALRSLPDWLYYAICDQREVMFHSDCRRSLIFIALAVAVIMLYVKGRMKFTWFAMVLGLLVVVDLWGVDRRYFNDKNFISARETGDSRFAPTAWENEILQDDGYFRVFNLTGNPFSDSRTSYRLKSIGGYSAVKLRRYNDLIEEHLSKVSLPVAGMLNAKYLVVPTEDGSAAQVEINPFALGPAWFVDRLIPVDNANMESEMLEEIELDHEAVVDKSFGDCLPDYTPAISQDASLNLVSHSPKYLDYKYYNAEPGTIVFSEIYYPHGWKAFIDGTPADYYRVNYLLRAMNVPAGEHSIHFAFEPDSVKKGDTIATICIILMYILIVSGIAVCIHKLVIHRKCSR